MKKTVQYATTLTSNRSLWLVLATLTVPHFMAHAVAGTPAHKLVHKMTQSRAEIKTQANQMAAGVRAAEAALSPDELLIAERVEVGQVNCEMGQFVNVAADAKLPGYFDVKTKKLKFRMTPVVSHTGAIRLEDTKEGAVWLQLANKSMLMSQKLGMRLADSCVSPKQAIFAAAMEKTPLPSLLDTNASADQQSPQAVSSAITTVQ